MKRLAVIAMFAFAAVAQARADVTNYVYMVTNIYVRVFETREVTNKVKNTHYNYYYTNNVTTITNIWTVNHITNINYDVVFDDFGPWIVAASNEANRASENAVAAANQVTASANYATLAGSRASSAAASAAQASAYATRADNAVESGVSEINSLIAWFDLYMMEIGQEINSNMAQNVSFPYVAPDGTAYSNIVYHVANANGRVSARPTGTRKAGTSLILYYNSGNGRGDYMYVYDLGYVSSDANGMLIRYVPRSRELKSFSRDSTERLFLPRDLIWQNGQYIAEFYIYSMATNWIGKWKVGGNKQGPFPYPDNIEGDRIDGEYMYYYPDTRLDTISKSDFNGHPYTVGANLNYLNIKTEQGSYLNSLVPLWIPLTPSYEQQKTLDWINSFPVR